MLSYKITKQLKDAGFPQDLKDREGSFYHKKSDPDTYLFPRHKDKNCIYNPSLSELIAACRNIKHCKLIGVSEVGKKGSWISSILYRDEYINEKGKSPEEAVAKLWLKLNKEKK